MQKCQTNYTKATYIICGLSAKNFFWPHGSPREDPKSQEPMSLDPKLFFCSNPLNKIPESFPHPQNNFWGSNGDLFSNQEANFEAEITSPNVYVGSVLNIFLHKITHTIDECSPNTNVGSWGISAHCEEVDTFSDIFKCQEVVSTHQQHCCLHLD